MSSSSSSSSSSSKGAADIANFAVRQSPATTQFITNKMCPFAQKAWIALEAAKAPYKMDEIPLYGTNGKPDWFLELNPEGTVPVLVCFGGAVVLPDSELILDFIADGAVEGGTGLVPPSSDPPHDQTMERINEWRDVVLRRVIPVGKAAVQKRGTRSHKDLMELLKRLDRDVIGPYLCGDTVTIADCAAFPFLWRIDQEFGPLNEDEHGCGRIRMWLDKCCERRAFKKTIQSHWWWWW